MKSSILSIYVIIKYFHSLNHSLITTDDYHVIDPDLINVEEQEQDVGFYDPDEEGRY